MKIKVKRYKEIEQIALSEALVKIITEAEMNTNEVVVLQKALNDLKLSPAAIQNIMAILRKDLKLEPNVGTTQTVATTQTMGAP